MAYNLETLQCGERVGVGVEDEGWGEWEGKPVCLVNK